ncbi:dephospho-CoA kinase [Clostridia bacterium]|nr:dephospho-CoA kinase [Clostridia bacterium]
MKILGVTGPSGAGKSTVLAHLASRGCFTILADEVYHQLLETGSELSQELEMRFPSVFTDHKLDRRELGRLVYADRAAKSDLELITHPAVLNEIEILLDNAREADVKIAVIEAIALIESGVDKLCDKVLSVTARPALRVDRITARDDVTFRYAAARMSAQRDDGFYCENADYHIENSGDISLLRARIDSILKEIQEA